MTPHFFGYGSLVNRRTHSYPDARPAQLTGWRRAWVRTAGREVVYLTVEPDPQTTIDGLIAAVPDADWAALDLREGGYMRVPSTDALLCRAAPRDVAHYVVPSHLTGAPGDHVILLSYLDVVVQGFYDHYGAAGVARFFATTRGWDAPVRNDRAAPLYPRHQRLSAQLTALVDRHLSTCVP